MKNKLTNRQQQALQTKSRIIESGRQLVAQKTIAEISIKDITKASGISTGTFYHYFQSKENFCAILALMPGTEITDSIRSNSSLGIVGQLRSFIMGRMLLTDKDGLALTRNLQAFKLTATYREIRREQYGNGHYDYEALMQVIQSAIENGELSPDFPAEMFVQTLVYLVHGAIFNTCLYNEAIHLSDWGQQFCDYMENVMLRPYLLIKYPKSYGGMP